MLVLLMLAVIGLGWDAHQQSQIEALPDVVDRLERAAERLEGMTVTAEGGDAVILLRTDLDRQALAERALDRIQDERYGSE